MGTKNKLPVAIRSSLITYMLMELYTWAFISAVGDEISMLVACMASTKSLQFSIRREKANNQRRNTLLWLKLTAQIFIPSQKAIEFNLLIDVKSKGELAVTEDQA